MAAPGASRRGPLLGPRGGGGSASGAGISWLKIGRARRAESAADAGADVLDEGVLHWRGDAGQVAERPDGTRPLLGLCWADFATCQLRQKIGEVCRVRGQEGCAHPGRVCLPPAKGGGVAVPRSGGLAPRGEREDGLRGGHTLTSRGGPHLERDCQEAARRRVKRLKAAGLPRTPTGDALPEELAASCLVEGHDVSCGRSGPRLRVRCQTAGGLWSRSQGQCPGAPGGLRG
jgi:hypothetical protein